MNQPCLKIVPQHIFTYKLEPKKFKFTKKDLILYSLGIGFNQDPMKEEDYKYTLEFNKSFSSFPTYSNLLVQCVLQILGNHPHIPKFNPYNIVHAEERASIFLQLVPDTDYQTDCQIVDLQDKGQNSIFTFRVQGFLHQGKEKKIAFQIIRKMYVKDLGGFGFKGKGQLKNIEKIPNRKCDYAFSTKIALGQAFIYRLSSDLNPLHVDPKASSSFKFERPIFHGLGTYGNVARIIVQKLFQNDPEKLKEYNVKFVGHVFPGETLNIEVWKLQNCYVFQVQVAQRNTKCMIGEFKMREASKL